MVAIAESVAKPASRFRFILDRRDVLGAIFVAPAILYVLLLVGVPFLMAVYYSVSAYTIYDPSWRFVGLANFEQIIENPDLLGRRCTTPSSSRSDRRFLGLVLGKFGALVLLRPFPGRKIRQGADHPALGGAGRARHRRLAVDVRFALQRHQLDDDRAWLHRPRERRRTGSAIRIWRCCR